MSATLPSEWHEVERPDYIVEKYRARNPTLFVREGHDVGVHVLPVSTSSPHDDESYRTGALRGDRDDLEYEAPIETFADRDEAFTCALEFANQYEAEYADRGHEVDALEAAVERLS